MASSGNFATWNGAEIPAYLSLSQGNTKVLGNTSTDASGMNLNTGVNSGKWYIEFYVILTTSSYPYIGLSAGPTSQDFAATNTGYNGDIRYHVPNSTGMGNNTGSSGITNRWGTITTTETGVDACSSGDIVGFALDMDNKKLFISRNGTFFNSGDPANGTNPQASWTTNPESAFINCFTYTSSRGCVVNTGQDSTFGGVISAGGNADGNGFGDFKYSSPTGFLALCSANLPISDDIDPAQTDDNYPGKQFGVAAWTGNAGTQTIQLGDSFKPDCVWMKNRGTANSWIVLDSTRGYNKTLKLETTDAEQTDAYVGYGIESDFFDSTGIKANSGGSPGFNASGGNYITYGWRANGGTTSSNSNGDITSTVQANTAAGFSIVTYTGDLTSSGNRTVGHGLSAAPEFIVRKGLNETARWAVSHIGLTSFNYMLEIDSTAAESDKSGNGSMSAPTTTVFSNNYTDGYAVNGKNYVAYCWHSVEGYSKFGKYEGNGNANGPFIYTGFRPRLLFAKHTTAARHWTSVDTARNTYNPSQTVLDWDANYAEYTSANRAFDIYSNGFKIRTSDGEINQSGSIFVYGAWADVPFKYNNTF
tara:strand:- start:113 stop:1879 length:1767 start_codon:yes stop_codon:yes gene_type:complete